MVCAINHQTCRLHSMSMKGGGEGRGGGGGEGKEGRRVEGGEGRELRYCVERLPSFEGSN